MSFQAVDLTDLYTGRVLLVKDCHNEITPYLNPSLSLIKKKLWQSQLMLIV